MPCGLVWPWVPARRYEARREPRSAPCGAGCRARPRGAFFSVIQITGVLSSLRDKGSRCERSHRPNERTGATTSENRSGCLRNAFVAPPIHGSGQAVCAGRSASGRCWRASSEWAPQNVLKCCNSLMKLSQTRFHANGDYAQIWRLQAIRIRYRPVRCRPAACRCIRQSHRMW